MFCPAKYFEFLCHIPGIHQFIEQENCSHVSCFMLQLSELLKYIPKWNATIYLWLWLICIQEGWNYLWCKASVLSYIESKQRVEAKYCKIWVAPHLSGKDCSGCDVNHLLDTGMGWFLFFLLLLLITNLDLQAGIAIKPQSDPQRFKQIDFWGEMHMSKCLCMHKYQI